MSYIITLRESLVERSLVAGGEDHSLTALILLVTHQELDSGAMLDMSLNTPPHHAESTLAVPVSYNNILIQYHLSQCVGGFYPLEDLR